MTRNSYDTALKHLIRLDCAQAIPSPLLQAIPKSCLYRWKKEPDNKYTGRKGGHSPPPNTVIPYEGWAGAAVMRNPPHPVSVHPLAGRYT